MFGTTGRQALFGCGIAAAFTSFLLSGAVAQSTSKSDFSATTSTSPSLAFESISIRQNVSGTKSSSFGPTADGFRMTNTSLGRLILAAYVPQTGAGFFWQRVGFPSWLSTEAYDIEAKVSEADLPEWQKSTSQPAMLRSMLQSLLADRCHLTVHRELKPADVYYLTVGKNGPKFQESKAGEPYPTNGGSLIPGAGVTVSDGKTIHFHQATMPLLAAYLTNMNLDGRAVQDRTGLTGRYDFVLQWGWTGGLGSSGDAPDSGPTLFSATDALGLKLVPAKGQEEVLVLDHIDHPTEN